MDGSNGKPWFWPAEEHFQHFNDGHDMKSRDESSTLSIREWMDKYAGR
jgi:hypothetical protein